MVDAACRIQDIHGVHSRTDSELVVNQMTGRCATRSRLLLPLRDALRQSLEGLTVTWEHRLRHDFANEALDRAIADDERPLELWDYEAAALAVRLH